MVTMPQTRGEFVLTCANISRFEFGFSTPVDHVEAHVDALQKSRHPSKEASKDVSGKLECMSPSAPLMRKPVSPPRGRALPHVPPGLSPKLTSPVRRTWQLLDASDAS